MQTLGQNIKFDWLKEKNVGGCMYLSIYEVDKDFCF